MGFHPSFHLSVHQEIDVTSHPFAVLCRNARVSARCLVFFPPLPMAIGRAWPATGRIRVFIPTEPRFSRLVRSYQLCCGGAVVGPSTFFVATRRELRIPVLAWALVRADWLAERGLACIGPLGFPTLSA